MENYNGFIVGKKYKKRHSDTCAIFAGISKNCPTFELVERIGLVLDQLPKGYVPKASNTYWRYEGLDIQFDPTPIQDNFKAGDWVVVIDSVDTMNDGFEIKGKPFQIKEEPYKKGAYGLYVTGYKDQGFSHLFPLSERGIYVKDLRKALPNEIPVNVSKFDKFDEVRFKNFSDNQIPDYVAEPTIPKDLIKHGSVRFKVNKGKVINFHDKYVIVSYDDENGRTVQLGFLPEKLEKIAKTEEAPEFIPEYVECIKKYVGSERWWNIGDVYELVQWDKKNKYIRVKNIDGECNGLNSELFTLFKPSTKEAFEAQNKKKSNNPITGRYYASKKTNNICRWGNNDSDYYLGGNIDQSNAQFIQGGGLFQKHNLREASLEEERWLEACILANKFVPKEEALSINKKEPEVWEPKVGDWIKILKSEKNWTSDMDVFIDRVVKITRVINYRIEFDVFNNWIWRLRDGHFRKALPHEIPISLPVVNWCIKTTQENKNLIRRWGKGIGKATDGTASYYGCDFSGDYWYSAKPWGTEVNTKEFCTITGYSDINKEPDITITLPSNISYLVNESLMEEAKRRYPTGTEYISAGPSGAKYVIKEDSCFESEDSLRSPYGDKCIGIELGGFLCYRGEWARILNNPGVYNQIPKAKYTYPYEEKKEPMLLLADEDEDLMDSSIHKITSIKTNLIEGN